MRKTSYKIIAFLVLALFAFLFGNSVVNDVPVPAEFGLHQEQSVSQDKENTEFEDVAAYIREYQCLPPNYLTKQEALDLGWVSSEGNLWEVADQMCIGGDRFGNREGKLPDVEGRIWYECDVNYYGGFRGGERIVYSNDGLLYYTPDHYNTFENLY